MSEGLAPVIPAVASPENDLTLALEQIREIHESISAAVAAGEAAQARIDELCGPAYGHFASLVRHWVLSGTGHQRHARDLIQSAFMQRNALLKETSADA